MRLLLDTNILLEILLGQENAAQAKLMLSQATQHDMFISDFTLHSIGIVLFRHKQYDAFHVFVNDAIFRAGITTLSLFTEDMENVARFARLFNLDFDDAYQYAAADKYKLTLVSFDDDFDRTRRGRQTPAQVLAQNATDK